MLVCRDAVCRHGWQWYLSTVLLSVVVRAMHSVLIIAAY